MSFETACTIYPSAFAATAMHVLCNFCGKLFTFIAERIKMCCHHDRRRHVLAIAALVPEVDVVVEKQTGGRMVHFYQRVVQIVIPHPCDQSFSNQRPITETHMRTRGRVWSNHRAEKDSCFQATSLGQPNCVCDVFGPARAWSRETESKVRR